MLIRVFTPKSTSLKIILFLGVILCSVTAFSQVQQSFSPRFSDIVHGDIAMIANNTVSNTATGSYTGTMDNHDTPSVFVDIDSDATTFNSSSANFSNPMPISPCLTIRKAYLYWSAADKEYDGTTTGNGGAEPVWNYNQVKLMLPGSSAYTTITADETIYRGRDDHFVNDPYVCIKDITDDVQMLSDPFGKFQVANVKGTEGILASHGAPNNTGTSGGWQIVFIYESPQLTRRNITLFDGYANVTLSHNEFNVDFNGFQTVPNGDVNANIVIGSLEGDRSIAGDALEIFNTSGSWEALSTAERDANNFFKSKITTFETPFVDRNPASTNTLGYDAALFRLDNPGNTLIGNNQTSATFRMTSNQETYGLYLLGFSVEVFEPSLGALSFMASVMDAQYRPGETAQLRIQVENVGNDNIQNLEIALTLPPQVEFPGSLTLPPGVTNSYNPVSRELRFFVVDGFLDINDPEILLYFPLLINTSCPSCSAAVGLQAYATFTGETNPNMVGTLSSGTLDACGIGNHDPTYLNIIPDIAMASADAVEGNAIVFEVLSSHLLANDAVFNLSYTNNTTAFTDYSQPATFTIPTGIGTTTLDIPTTDDTIIENDETFDITINTTANVTIINDMATGTIIDNDFMPGSGIEFANTNIIVTEGTDAFALININLIGTISENVTFDYTTNTGTAFTVEDFTATAGTLTFTPNISTVEIQVPITDDMITEPTEDFSIILSNIQSSLGIGFTNGNASNTANVTINDDDVAMIVVEAYEEEITITCGEEIPEVPTLIFSGGCGNYAVNFTEEEEFVSNTQDFLIIRIWTVTDSCGNTASFQQTIFVLQPQVEEFEISLCTTDNPIDLLDFLPNTFNTDGTFTVTTGNITISGSEFNPTGLEADRYLIQYEATTNSCSFYANYTIDVTECIECNVENLVVSKTITVNSDGINDYFEITGLETCNYTYQVMIFNRWGTKVFESNDYQNDWGAFAPDSSIGTSGTVPSGTYYYMISLSDPQIAPVNGYIYIGSN